MRPSAHPPVPITQAGGPARARRHRPAGFSLLEMLLSLSLGLLLVLALAQAHGLSGQWIRQHEDQAALDEPGRLALAFLVGELQSAGYVDWLGPSETGQPLLEIGLAEMGLSVGTGVQPAAADPSAWSAAPGAALGRWVGGLTPLFGCDGDMEPSPHALLQSGSASGLTCGTRRSTRHTLQIARQSSAANAATQHSSLGAQDPLRALDCLQQGAGGPAPLVINRFRIAVSGGDSQLQCAGSGNASAQALWSGVEELVFHFDVQHSGAWRWLSASQTSDLATNPGGWAAVRAVHVCLLMGTSSNQGAASWGSRSLQAMRPTCARDAAGAHLPDQARLAHQAGLWRRFSAVVALPNQSTTTQP